MRVKTALLCFFLLCNSLGFVFGQNMIFQRVYDSSLSQASYIIANDQNKAIVIDPKRDIDTYLDFAKQHQLDIVYVSETHIHADFLSGSRELAKASNAELLLSDAGPLPWKYDFSHTPLNHNDVIDFGNLQIKVIHTPGHTPESITFLISDLTNPQEPIKAITGDFIFVSDLGRPDLLQEAVGVAGESQKGALDLFESLTEFSKLPEDTQIWPGHGAGSFCGKSLSNIAQSTLKIEKKTSKPFALLNDKQAFVGYILQDQPAIPAYFKHMKQLNKQERALLIQIPKIPRLSMQEFKQAASENLLIIDTRSWPVVAKGYFPGSIHVGNSDSFSTFIGSLVDYGPQIVLITDSDQIQDITRKLMRIGMDNIYGYFSDIQALQELEKMEIIHPEKVQDYQGLQNVQLIDVRSKQEYESGHIKGFQNISLNNLQKEKDKIDPNKTIVIHCQSGTRSAIAYTLLKKMGFKDVVNFSQGIQGYTSKGLPLVK
ncbi:MBL fold metallo-hydrolase [Myroides sp. LJL119]